MQSRFEFLNDQFPELAGYGKKAEEVLDSDNNICLLNLGRIAETITKILCRVNNIEKNLDLFTKLEELAGLKVIDSEIEQKIKTLIEIKNDAEENNYDSEMASSRLMTTAQELCEWFTLKQVENKFEFLAELFPPDFIPPLVSLAEIGHEAEENLFTNTRYCLICLGDIGEAIVDYLISANSISAQRDHLDRINVLFNLEIIKNDKKDALHNLRIARNNAVHERYNNTYTSEEEAGHLLEDVLKLCQWLFRLVLKPGYIVKGRVAEINEDSISVLIGAILAKVSLNEIPVDENGISLKDSYVKGKKYIFKVLENEGDIINLSLIEADKEYNSKISDIKRKYEKYNVGQEVKAKIIRINTSSGAFVELSKSGLPARIPSSEIVGRKLYSTDESGTKHVKYDVLARVKCISPSQYPPMILSLKEIEKKKPVESAGQSKKSKPPINNLAFVALCRNAGFDRILKFLDNGADPNAENNKKLSALMVAANFNKLKAVKALLAAGANVNAKNHEGNTALHFAAIQNSHDVIEELINAGADVDAINKKKKKPIDYARVNKKLNDYPYIIELLTKEKPEENQNLNAEPESKTETPTPVEPAAGSEIEIETETPAMENKIENENPPEAAEYQAVNPVTLLDLCKNGTTQEISDFIESHANSSVNVSDNEGNSALHLAARYNSADAVRILLEHGADVNATNNNDETPLIVAIQPNRDILEIIRTLLEYNADVNAKSKPLGNTALHFALGYNYSEVCMELINSGALNIPNNNGTTPLEIAKRREMTTALENLFQKNFLKICRSGSSTEIAEAIAAGVNVNAKNRELRTALMFAALYNTADAVSMLIEARAYIDAQDIYGRTALIYAASRNTDDVVELLIDAGADIELKDTAGFSAYDYGMKNHRLIDTEALNRLKSEN